MSALKVSDLLPIDPALRQPNAYQVFGLPGPEADSAAVNAAIKRVYAGLKAAKSTADPQAWKRAAQLAESARKVLQDPQQRRALDARLAATGPTAPQSGPPTDSPGDTSDAQSDQAAAGAADPLAGLLPPANPLGDPTPAGAAGSHAPPSPEPPPPLTATEPSTTSTTRPQASAVLGMAPGIQPAADSPLGSPPLGTPPVAPTAKAPPTAPIDFAPTPTGPRRTRRRRNTGAFLFGGFVVLMLGAIVGLLSFLTGGGRIAFNQGGSTQPPPSGVAVAPPAPLPQRQPPRRRDGVLDQAPSSGVAESLRNGPATNQPPAVRSPLGSIQPQGSSEAEESMPGMDTGPTSAAEPAMPPEPSEPAPESPDPADPSMEPDPGGGGGAGQPDAEMVQANEAELDRVEQLIRGADWEQMKPAAEVLLERQLTPEQAKRAETLYDIADLATFYRGAIGRGLASLSVGNTFDYIDGLSVIVVEASDRELTIKYNRRTKTFQFENLPPRLTERIAAMALPPDRPDAIAGLALYRLVRPATNEGYRQDALELLESVQAELDEVDGENLVRVSRALFAN